MGHFNNIKDREQSRDENVSVEELSTRLFAPPWVILISANVIALSVSRSCNNGHCLDCQGTLSSKQVSLGTYLTFNETYD